MRRFGIFVLACFTAVLVSSELTLSLPIRGVGPDVLMLVVVAFAIGEEPRRAALSGFAAGLLRDLLLASPKGVSAFAYAVTAFAASLAGGVRGVWAFVGLVAGATFASQALYGFATTILSPNVDVSALPRTVLLSSTYNALLAPLLMPLLRKVARTQRTAGAELGTG